MAELIPGALVGACDVREIVDSDLTDLRLNNFCNMAHLMVTPLLGELDACGGEAVRKYIALLLAAHFVTLYERTIKSENVAGEYSVTYAMSEGLGLDASLYGQQAKALDCSGKLASAGSKAASFEVVSYYQIANSGTLFDQDLL